MSVDYTLYLVTDRGILKGRDLADAVEEAIKGGVTLVQLREKDVSSLEFYNIAIKLKQLTNKYKIPLIINDRLDIALAADADGLHVGQDDLPVEVARKLLGPDKILGYSVSTIEEAVYGEKMGADYLGAGPVYPTGSKLDAVSPIGIDTFHRIKESVSIPVVGIGGIGISNIKEMKASGADGISLISAILGSKDIKEASRNLIRLWGK
jgi:thiamine-phosphate pyrophosphorylase